MELDRLLWRNGEHVAIKQLADDFARYVYLPRLADSNVLLGAVRDGLALLTWDQDSFAYADSFDEAVGRYRGLRGGRQVSFDADSPGLLVKSAVARKQLDAETSQNGGSSGTGTGAGGGTGAGTGGGAGGGTAGGPTPAPPQPKRFHGTVVLDATRVGRDAGRIGDEVIAHLAALVGANVTVTLEIHAQIPMAPRTRWSAL